MPTWVSAGALADLQAKGRRLIRHEGRQIAVFYTGAPGGDGDTGDSAPGGDRVLACANRCPHEGYPLIEGGLSEGCVLTCNWHNWKFNLRTGETLIGGDAVVTYPADVRGGEVFIDASGPAPETRRARALAGLRDVFGEDDRPRIAREIARYQQAGGDPLDMVREAVHWAHARLEFGVTHAAAAAPDWLALRRTAARTEAEKLSALAEIAGHLNWDSLREPEYPFAEGTTPFDAESLTAAVEAEDEAAAVRLIRGALREGRPHGDIFRALSRAALAHYADFGHSAIYCLKTEQLLDALGPETAPPLLFSLVRALIMAWREDLLPEFRHYAPALAAWDGDGDGAKPADAPVDADAFAGLGVAAALQRCHESSARPDALYHALLHAAARQWLMFDVSMQDSAANPVSRNVDWLDFTHAVTFANAARHLCLRDPSLWPNALLQMACFLGRNAGFLDTSVKPEDWRADDSEKALQDAMRGLFDHGRPEFIVSAHLVKILTAITDECAAHPDAPWRDDMTAAWRRMAALPFKRRHALRDAGQALDFTARE